jgi:hypothetical protein
MVFSALTTRAPGASAAFSIGMAQSSLGDRPCNRRWPDLRYSPGPASSNASLFFVSGGQVNLQIPWSATGGISWLTASVNGQTGAASPTFTLVPFAPGIFSMNGQGSGQGAILNSQYHQTVGRPLSNSP